MEDKMGRTCRTHAERKNICIILVENLRAKCLKEFIISEVNWSRSEDLIRKSLRRTTIANMATMRNSEVYVTHLTWLESVDPLVAILYRIRYIAHRIDERILRNAGV
jgi:hypothetical protein